MLHCENISEHLRWGEEMPLTFAVRIAPLAPQALQLLHAFKRLAKACGSFD